VFLHESCWFDLFACTFIFRVISNGDSVAYSRSDGCGLIDNLRLLHLEIKNERMECSFVGSHAVTALFRVAGVACAHDRAKEHLNTTNSATSINLVVLLNGLPVLIS
jgi:hypothetical protein